MLRPETYSTQVRESKYFKLNALQTVVDVKEKTCYANACYSAPCGNTKNAMQIK